MPDLPLACVLEGGTWAAGRELARELRGGGPPLVDRRSATAPSSEYVTSRSRTTKGALIASTSNRQVHVFDHPLVQHKLTLLRKKETSTTSFRRLLNEIGSLMAYEVTRDDADARRDRDRDAARDDDAAS